MRKVFLSVLFILIPFTIAGGASNVCKTPDRKYYKTKAGQTSVQIDTHIVEVTAETQGKYVEILTDETELDYDLHWFWIRFEFKNKSRKAIATMFVHADFYDEGGKKVHESETRVFNNRSCKSNTPITKDIISKSIGFIKDIPPQADSVKWRINKIGFAIEAR